MTFTLKALRVNKNLSADEAARELGVVRETLYNWESGKSYPNALQIKKIEEVYETHFDEINFLIDNNKNR